MILKRIIDIISGVIGLIITSPLWLYVVIKIKTEDRGPVFFVQERVGRNSRLFRMYKFRSMVVGAEKKGLGVFVSTDDERITKIGKFIRKTSIDELPQLINVLKGEMSIVGPRPTLEYQVERYNKEQKRRLLVKPGITGWAQVNGRNNMTWPEKIKLDLWYVDHWSVGLDLKIIGRTIILVIKRKGIYAEEGIIVDEISRIDYKD
ncbi:MAG: sugar transferase [Atribacterota bacterium]|jgi:undecaprenyl phosphate N,N'-diacetylbacillosamine 1-phosphate transferase|nr:sugar transferase [Atribacterota bacterium]HHT11224.1 sugar transferase [Candidatus Atribacteria bacterium]